MSLGFVAAGVHVNPQIGFRLERRHAPSRFGTVRSVDEDVISPEDGCEEDCAACSSCVRAGLVRRYREQYVLAGIPIYTISEGDNHYCLECVAVELSVGRARETSGGRNWVSHSDARTLPKASVEGTGENEREVETEND